MQPLQTENVCYNNVHKISGGVAQLGERTVRIRKVESSILFVSTNNKSHLYGCGLFFYEMLT